MNLNRRKKRLFRLGAAAVLLIVVLAVWFVFQVRIAEVYGNELYTSEEIVSGLVDNFLTKNTLYLAWKYKDGDIPNTLPYLDSLSVEMVSLSQIQIVVTEKALAGYIDKGEYVYFDHDGIVLKITEEKYNGIPLITGIASEEAVLYQKLPTESSATLRTILSLTQLLEYQGLEASEIRFSDNSEVTVYIGRVAAQLGQDEYLEEKVANLRKILENLEGQSGTLHLENFTGHNETVSFTPSGEVETEAPQEDSDSSGNDSSGDTDNGSDDTGGGSTDGDSDAGDGSTDDGSGDTGGSSGEGSDGTGSGDSMDSMGDGADDGSDDTGDDGTDDEGEDDSDSDSYVIIDMVFNSSGTLVYNVHAENGNVVDSSGNIVPGCYVDDEGYIFDAYMNRFDPVTGELSNDY